MGTHESPPNVLHDKAGRFIVLHLNIQRITVPCTDATNAFPWNPSVAALNLNSFYVWGYY